MIKLTSSFFFYFHFFQIIGMYFIEKKNKEETILKALNLSVSLLSSRGFKVLAIICDQEPVHQKLYRMNVREDGTLNIGGESVSLIFDVPHLLKSTRNCFLSKGIMVSHCISIRSYHRSTFL